jgi:PAT family beta-lactamase induction signal transducer AmpG
VGGALIYRLGYFVPMFIFGVLQGISTLLFVILTKSGPDLHSLALVIFFEDFSSGMGTAALVAFMASMTNKRFTATQYALFASLASFGRTFFSGFSGDLIVFLSGVSGIAVDSMDKSEKMVLYMNAGYPRFFIFCAIIALPGIVLLFSLWQQKEDFVTVKL